MGRQWADYGVHLSISGKLFKAISNPLGIINYPHLREIKDFKIGKKIGTPYTGNKSRETQLICGFQKSRS